MFGSRVPVKAGQARTTRNWRTRRLRNLVRKMNYKWTQAIKKIPIMVKVAVCIPIGCTPKQQRSSYPRLRQILGVTLTLGKLRRSDWRTRRRRRTTQWSHSGHKDEQAGRRGHMLCHSFGGAQGLGHVLHWLVSPLLFHFKLQLLLVQCSLEFCDIFLLVWFCIWYFVVA